MRRTSPAGATQAADRRHLWELVEWRAAKSPERELAVGDQGRRMTFGEYRSACLRVAAGLAERGVCEGTRVSWQLPTWLESVVLVGARDQGRSDRRAALRTAQRSARTRAPVTSSLVRVGRSLGVRDADAR
jgi:non-ribosomal peptide synthetase component F